MVETLVAQYMRRTGDWERVQVTGRQRMDRDHFRPDYSSKKYCI